MKNFEFQVQVYVLDVVKILDYFGEMKENFIKENVMQLENQ
jgi:hypothetical protein